MATGRNDVDFIGIDALDLSFKYDGSIVFSEAEGVVGGSVSVGLAVKITGARTVGLTTDASPVFGKLTKVEKDGFCTVQVEGGCDLPAGASATVGNGNKIVGALGASSAPGYIRQQAVATLAEVAVGAHTIIDNTDTAAVQVWLD